MNLQNKGLSLSLTQITLHLIRTRHLIVNNSIIVQIIIKVMNRFFLQIIEHTQWEISTTI